MNEARRTPAVHPRMRMRRLGATVLDFVLVAAVAPVVLLVTGAMESAEAYLWPQPALRIPAVVAGTYVLINGLSLARHGQTVGKRMLALRIQSSYHGGLLPFWQLCIRAFALPGLAAVVWTWAPVVILVIDTLLVFGRRQRCLHDLICGSIVVSAPPR
jgi:uncharacterized RDD family membrane protein YckC